MKDSNRGEHRSLVSDGRTLLRRLGRSKLDRHLRAMLLVRPARGRSMVYATLGNEALLEALAENRHFCRDTGLGGMLHPKRVSFRELSTRPGLHVALEAHDRIAAHLDRETPAVGRRPDGSCLYTRSRTAHHIWRDVLPSLVRPPSGDVPTPRKAARPWHLSVEARPFWRLGNGSSWPRPPARLRPTRSAGRGLGMTPAPPVGKPGSEGGPHRGPPAGSLIPLPEAGAFRATAMKQPRRPQIGRAG